MSVGIHTHTHTHTTGTLCHCCFCVFWLSNAYSTVVWVGPLSLYYYIPIKYCVNLLIKTLLLPHIYPLRTATMYIDFVLKGELYMYFWCLGHFVTVSSLIQLLISAEKRKKGVKCGVNETKSNS